MAGTETAADERRMLRRMAPGDPAGPVETELKLSFPASARERIDESPVLRDRGATAPRERHLVTTYYDTAGFALAAAGLTLRVRQSEGRPVQTVKCQRDGQGTARRGEWEWPVATDKPEFGLIAQIPPGAGLDPRLAESLEPVSVSDIRRTVRMLQLEDGTSVELALDEGCIRAGSAEEPVHELELELKGGPAGPLYRLALELHAQLPLRLEAVSKAARGYRLKTGRLPEAETARPPALGRDAGAAEGFRRIVLVSLDHLLANQPAAASGDVEGVHQMRVALRRLRTALVLFGPHLEPHAAAQFQAELRRLGQVFGDARDWDVFCLETLPDALSEPVRSSWRHLLERAAAAERAAAHDRLKAELAGPAPTGLALGLSAWTEEKPRDLGDDSLRGRLANLAPDLLGRLERKVLKRGRHIARLSGEDLHAVRKSLKKLRYGVDDLADLFPRKRTKAYLKRCKALQTLLGHINDAAMAVTLAERLGRDSRSDFAAAISAMAQWSDRRRNKALDRLPKAWTEFRDTAPPWR